jgi:hypothetical protein
MSKQDPQLRSIHDAWHALMLLGYPETNINQFVPIPEPTNEENGLKTIDAQISQRAHRVLMSALRSQRDSLEKRVCKAPAGEKRSNMRADLDTTKELIATLQL